MLPSFSPVFTTLGSSCRPSITRSLSTFNDRANLDVIRKTSAYQSDGFGSIFNVALYRASTIRRYNESGIHKKSGTPPNGAWTMYAERHVHAVLDRVENCISTEAYLHYALNRSGLTRVPYMCACGTMHHKLHRFTGSAHWDQILTSGLNSLGIRASKIWLTPTSSSLSAEVRKAYDAIRCS
ncbi:hypothetical protein R3P38DRAFT_3213970 [Favolaschia claudopus]|uniref:Uncharacterized protein n=1 Tax=Favolaschia claudopus TaxID=2862362 RepID=A0AAW0ABV2_9AGAR